VAVGALSWTITQSQGTRATAETILSVPAGEGEGLPGDAQQAVTLAGTYAALIPVDGAVLRRVGQAVDQSPEQVEESLAATSDESTAVVRVTFEHEDERLAVRGAQTVTAAVTGADPVAAVGGDVLERVRDARVISVTGLEAETAALIGAILGALLGLVLLVAWERIDPRVDHAEVLTSQFGVPASSLRDLPRARAAALLERWQSIAGVDPASLRVTFLAATPGAERLARGAAERLVTLGAASGMPVGLGAPDADEQLGAGTGGVSFVVGGAPGTGAASEGLAAEGDLTVIVVRRGTRAAALRPSLAALSQFGVSPDWALVAAPRDIKDRIAIPAVGAPTGTREATRQ